jgi:ankyrin repeat protein
MQQRRRNPKLRGFMAKKGSKSAISDPFSDAVEHGDLGAIRELIKAGHKPSAAAVEEAAEACNDGFAAAYQDEDGLFRKKPSNKAAAKAAARAEKYFEIVEALLKAGGTAPESELCSAARSGNTKLALLLIKARADVSYAPPMGTALRNAVKSGSQEIVGALLRAGADVHEEGFFGTLLMEAISANHSAIAEQLIKAGLDVNAEPKFGAAALLRAVADRKVEFVKMLLAAGANVNQKGSVTCGDFGKPEITEEGGFRTTHIPNPPVARDSTPLIVAVRRRFAEIAKILIEAHADLEAKDRDGFTALVHALKSGDQKLVKLLQDAGAKRSEHAEGSAEAAFMAAAKNGDCKRLQSLISGGVDVNTKRGTDEEAERTALIHAAENGHVEAVQFLLKAGARVDEKCGQGCDCAEGADESHNRTALMHAAKAGHVEVIHVLLEAKASITAKDRDMGGGGRTPLHYAAETGQAEAIRVLVDGGAKVDAKDKSNTTPLMTAAAGGFALAVDALLELGADANNVSKDGLTPLYFAASQGSAEVVAALLKAGARPESAEEGLSPLEAASSEGHQDVVKLLLKAGVPARGKGKKDKDALAHAALMGKTTVVQTLLEAGADPNEADEEKFTPLMAAVRRGDLELIEILLKAGADVNARNEEGETPLDLAFDTIKVAKDQAKFLKMLGDLDEGAKKAINEIKKMGSEDEITAILTKAGGKRGKELGPMPYEQEEALESEVDLEPEMPDFSKAAKASEFKKAVEELSRICGGKPKPLSNEEGDALSGCVTFKVPTNEAEKILQEHHESFLARGCYFLRHERGYTSGKDELAALATRNWRDVLKAFQTNGANCNIYTNDIISWLEKLEKDQPFMLTGAGFDWCEGHFTKPIKNSRKLAEEMYEFCPDIVDQGTGEVSRLANELKKTQKFFFWWD